LENLESQLLSYEEAIDDLVAGEIELQWARVLPGIFQISHKKYYPNFRIIREKGGVASPVVHLKSGTNISSCGFR
jgi:hypothetical protein